MKKKWHVYIIYLSLLFLLFTLHRKKYLFIPAIYSGFNLGLSFVFLLLGFVFSAISHQRFLFNAGYSISVPESIIMVGLNIFTKYIPGKFMTVMGKAIHLSELKGFGVLQTSILFLQIQFVTLWCGLVLAITGLFFIDISIHLSLIGLLGFVVFSIFIFSGFISDKIKTILGKVTHREIPFYNVSMATIMCSAHWFIGAWLLWGVGFYFMAAGMSEQHVAISVIFCFPLAGAIGVMALISPGGIGVRESIIVGFLTSVSMDLSLAITIAAISRLWFLIGEFFIFLAGYYYRRNRKGTNDV
jgi:uncharacterized membrane protein YbhN (UPF0104 family)